MELFIGRQEAYGNWVRRARIVNDGGRLMISNCAATVEVYGPDCADHFVRRIKECVCGNRCSVWLWNNKSLLMAATDRLESLAINSDLVRTNGEDGFSCVRELTNSVECREWAVTKLATIYCDYIRIIGGYDAFGQIP